MKELWNIPVVYKLTKCEKDPDMVKDYAGNVPLYKEKPTLLMYMDGYGRPIAEGCYVFQDAHGLWRAVGREEYDQWLQYRQWQLQQEQELRFQKAADVIMKKCT